MNRLQRPFNTCALAVVLAGAFFCGVALADEDDHVESVASHMDSYEQEVDEMIGAADAIVTDYSDGQPVTDQADALVARWKSVEFHEALEDYADALYPPIWAAVTGMKEAVSQEGAEVQVGEARQDLTAALYEGLGALKLVAANDDAGAEQATASASAPEGQSTITVIKDNLQQALAAYNNGDTETARKQIHQTYMQQFEGIEGDLIERDAELVTGLETDFNATLPNLMEEGAPVSEVSEQIADMNDDLDTAKGILDEAAEQDSDVF